MKREYHSIKYALYILMMGFGLLFADRTVLAQEELQLKAVVADYQSVLLQWDCDSEEDTFQVRRRLKGENEYTVLATTPGQIGTMECYDYNVEMGNTYSYRVVQLSGDVVKRESQMISLQVKLPSPSRLKGKVIKDSRVKLSWDKVSRATGYTIYRSTKAKKGYVKLATVRQNTYTDYDIKKGKSYYYKIVANYKKKQAWSSNKCNAVCISVKPATPKVVGSYAKKKIKLTWKKVNGADYYDIYKKNAKGKYVLISQTSKLNFIDSNVKSGKTYLYKVAAVKQTGESVLKGKASVPCKVLASAVDPNKKMVALTYDDGPGMYTKDIVKCLKENQAKATFFVVGSNIDSYKSALKAADKIGCEIGNHTYSHADLSRESKEAIWKEIQKTDSKLCRVIGKKTTVMRPPYGSVNSTVKENVGKPMILWSIDTRDWEHRDSSRTISAVMNNIQDGDIVLMHDIHYSTKTASLSLIPQLRRAGYQLVTVSELAKHRGYKLQKGQVYHYFKKKK